MKIDPAMLEEGMEEWGRSLRFWETRSKREEKYIQKLRKKKRRLIEKRL